MTASPSPVVAVNVLQAPIVDDNGRVTPSWIKWFQNITVAVNAGLTTVGTALKLPFPTLATLGGVRSVDAVEGQFVTDIDALGVPHLSAANAASIVGIGTGATTATSANAGAATALPATPAGYLVLTVNGTSVKVPYFAL